MTTKIRSLVALCVILVLASCQNKTMRIEANLQNLDNGTVYLSVYDSVFNVVPIDSTQSVDGQFFFEANEPIDRADCMILSNNTGFQLPFFIGNEHVKIEGDLRKLEDLKVTGSEYYAAVESFVMNMPESKRLKQLQYELQNTLGDVDRRQVLKEEIENIQLEQLAYVKKWISSNSKSPLGPFVLSNYMPYFTFEEVDAFVDSFKMEMADYKFVMTLSNIVDNSRAEYEARKAVEIGCVAPDFTLEDINGNDVKLSELRGKIVLLDFWASWCLPCRRNNQTLRSVYSKFASKNVEIVCVSLDPKIESWRTAVAEDQMPGIQLIDSGNIVGDIYCVRSIPSSFLLDEQGVIVSKDVDIRNLFEDLQTAKTMK